MAYQKKKPAMNPEDYRGSSPIVTEADRLTLLEGEQYLLVDEPAPFVRRLTLNRPAKRNALRPELRAQLHSALQRADQDASVRVVIICGAGPSFCAGYDLSAPRELPPPQFQAGGDGSFQRAAVQGWFGLWDLAKPLIAQVHGHCLAGGSELASACDLIYCAEDAKIGYPPVRSMGLPDTQIFPWVVGMRASLELMLTGDSMSGTEAARLGWCNRAFPAAELEARTLAVARRVAAIPSDLLQFNKRSVHRAMEVMGMRTALRYGTDLQALSFHTQTSVAAMQGFGNGKSAAVAFKERDAAFGVASDDDSSGKPSGGPKSKL